MSKVANSYTQSHLMTSLGVAPFEFRMNLISAKTSLRAVRRWRNHDVLTRYQSVTGGKTDRRTGISAALLWLYHRLHIACYRAGTVYKTNTLPAMGMYITERNSTTNAVAHAAFWCPSYGTMSSLHSGKGIDKMKTHMTPHHVPGFLARRQLGKKTIGLHS